MSVPIRSETEQVSRKQASSSVLKALEVIDVLAEARGPVSLRDLARILGRPSSSLHRLLRSLELRGYVEGSDGSYRLTLKLFDLGMSVMNSIDIVAEARPFCADLCHQVNEVVNMSIRSGTSAVYVCKFEAPRSMRLISQLGMHVPLYCTAMGKSLLAFLPDDQRTALLGEISFEAQTTNTICDRPAFEAELAAVTARGWAVDNEEFDYGIVCVGAPIFNSLGNVAAAISIAGPAARLTRAEWPRLGGLVQEGAARISRRLGYKPSERYLQSLEQSEGRV